MSLRELLLTNKIPDPFSRAFSWEKWGVHLNAKSLTSEDTQLLESAKVIRSTIERLLEKLHETAYASENPWTLMELLVLYTNSQAFHLSRDGTNKLKQTKYYIGSTPRLDTNNGNQYTVDDLHTFITDALRLPLEDMKPKLSEESQPLGIRPAQSTIDDIPIINSIAIAWNAIKTTWQRCLYNGYTASETEDAFIFEGKDDHAYFILARHREYMETLSEYASYGRTALAKAGQKTWKDRKFATSGLDISLIGGGTSTKEIEARVVGPFFRENVLPTVLHAGTGLTVSELLSAWELLAEISDYQTEELEKLSENADDFNILAEARFSEKSLRTVLINSLAINDKKAGAILNILSSAEGKADPWAKPLIKLFDGTYMMLMGVLRWANRSFALERILRSQKYDMEERGPALEKFTRRKLLESLEYCDFRQITFVSPTSIILKSANGPKEEVDLLFCLGKDLYILECKASLFPADIEDDFFLTKKFLAADAQLNRKIAFLNSNLPNVARLHESLVHLPTTPKNVRGIIVSNFVGGSPSWTKNPIIDPESLSAYFGAGASVSKLEIHPDGSSKAAGKIVRYYNSFETFRTHFPKYLAYSPHANVFRTFLRQQDTKFSLSRYGLKDFRVLMPEVVLPDDEELLDKGIEVEYDNFRKYLWR
jgi:hypothetical protein